mgnify:CR=1 FL=1
MAHSVHRLLLPLEFPEGISPGEGKQGNLMILARDGQERPVLRGTALAGALRHAWARSRDRRLDDPDVKMWFGMALEGEAGGTPSPLRVSDCVIETGKISGEDPVLRTHNAIDRHTGAALNAGLFTLQSLPPGSHTNACLWLHYDGEPGTAKAFLSDLVGIIRSGLTLGGHAARGIGRAQLAEQKAQYRAFDCSNLEEHAAMLDENSAWRNGHALTGGAPLEPSSEVDGQTLRIDLALAISPGEDMLVGDGQGLDYEVEPQRVKCADGHERWRLPGSALRGVFRAWITRLAARAGQPVADSLERRKTNGKAPSGAELAWGFDDAETRERKQDALADNPKCLSENVTCQVMRLFGSSYAKSRIHISDAFASVQKAQEQVRAHVAVDRITGGANEGFFFKNAVLTTGAQFQVRIDIREPGKEEALWLAGTLRALHLGILRVGSSKAGGRLHIIEKPRASGPCADIFNNLDMSEV